MNCRNSCAALLGILLMLAASHAQSLADIARQQKESKSHKSDSQSTSTPKKVYTDEDIGKSKSGDVGAPAAADKSSPKSSTSSQGTKEKTQPTMSADQWGAKIQKKKDLIAAMQERIDTLEASVNYVQNNRNIYTNAPEYNGHQHQKELAAQQLKAQMEQQKAELSDLQEQARQQGFGNSVYQ
jgi:uncharacterized protein (DUF342 family)